MDRRVITVCCVVGFLGLLSAATGFAAEATRIKDNQVQFPSPYECSYPRSPAMGLGFTAAVALMIAQIIINIATGCICCSQGPRQSNSKWNLTVGCYIVSWLTFVVAFLLLLMAAALNAQHGEDGLFFSNYYCYVVKPGAFATASVLSLVSVALGIFYYLTLNSKQSRNNMRVGTVHPSQSGIAMGQPQFPTQNVQDPVFVHEDTYMRRQFM